MSNFFSKLKTIPEKLKKSADEKIKFLKSLEKKHVIIVFSIMALLFTAVFIFRYSNRFSINPDINHVMEMIPEDVSMYIEVKNMEKLKNSFNESQTGKKILNSPEWKNFISAYTSGINSITYFLGVKSKITEGITDITTFIDSNAGLARFSDGSWISIAKANLKSKIGAAVFSAFKSEKVELPAKETKKTEAKEEFSDGGDNKEIIRYTDAYEEEQVPMQNLTASKVMIRSKAVYFVVMGDYLFVSDNLTRLSDSLRLAGSKGKGLSSLAGFKSLSDDYSQEDSLSLVYFNSKNSPVSPVINSVAVSTGAAFIIKGKPGTNLNADIFLLGSNTDEKKSSPESQAEPEKLLPSDMTFAFISKPKNLLELLKTAEDLGDTWSDLKKGLGDYLQKTGLNESESIKNSKGFSFVFHGFADAGSIIVPDVSVLMYSQKEERQFFQSIFSGGNTRQATFQNRSYTVDSKVNGSFQPSFWFSDQVQVESSSQNAVEKFISSRNGNSAVLSDLKTAKDLGEYSKSPFQLIVNLSNLKKSLLDFFYYGSRKDSRYSEITISRDIEPLFRPFENYRILHLAINPAKSPQGKVILGE